MVDMNTPGLKIFNFHPIDLYYNTLNIQHRNQIKNIVNKISEISINNSRHLKNKKHYGIRDYFIDLVKFIKNKEHNTIFCSELNRLARENIKYNE